MDTKKLCEMIEEWPEDKQTTGVWYNDSTGQFCAVGWLLHKNGTPLEVVSGMFTSCFADNLTTEDEYTRLRVEAAQKLKAALGATFEDIKSIWHANDAVDSAGWQREGDSRPPKQRVQEKFCGL